MSRQISNSAIIAMRRGGAGPREIARDLGISVGVVAGVLFRAGLTDRNTPHTSPDHSARTSAGAAACWADPVRGSERRRKLAATWQAKREARA